MRQKTILIVAALFFILIIGLSGQSRANIGGKAIALANTMQLPDGSLPPPPPQTLASSGCSRSDPACSSGIVDGCDVRSDLIIDSNYVLPMGIDVCANGVTIECRDPFGEPIILTGDPATVGRGIENVGFNDVVIQNCIIQGYRSPESSAIYFSDANNILVQYNTIRDSNTGIYLQRVIPYHWGRSRIEDNDISNSFEGIKVQDSFDLDFNGNTIEEMRDDGGVGLNVERSSSLEITGIQILRNGPFGGGVGFIGISLTNSPDNRLRTNRIDGVIGTNPIGIKIVDSSNNQLLGNSVDNVNGRGSGVGILLKNAPLTQLSPSTSTSRRNTIQHNDIGLRIEDDHTGDSITQNTVCNNNPVDISVDVRPPIAIGDDNACNDVNNWYDDGEPSNCDRGCFCGNGIIEPGYGEECDDGGSNGYNRECTPDWCKHTYCGDSVVQSPNGRRRGGPANNGVEVCDDGNTIPDDGCDNCAAPTYCGDGFTTCPNDDGFCERCDDWADGDDTNRCYDDCTNTYCSDGIVQWPNGGGGGGPANRGYEECDDGNALPGDGCTTCDMYTDTECETPAEYLIVLDTSASMSGSKLDTAKEAIIHFAYLLILPEGAGLVTFADDAILRTPLTTLYHQIREGLRFVTAAGQSHMDLGINTAQNHFDAQSPSRPIMAVISDGMPTDPAAALVAANNAKSRGTEIYAVGIEITDAATRDLLIAIATDEAHFIDLIDLGLLDVALEEIRSRSCLCGNGILDSGEECDDGNNVNGDGCSSTCREECGGYLQQCCAPRSGAPGNPLFSRCIDHLICTSGTYGVGGTCTCPIGATWNPGIQQCECTNGGMMDYTTGACTPPRVVGQTGGVGEPIG